MTEHNSQPVPITSHSHNKTHIFFFFQADTFEVVSLTKFPFHPLFSTSE